MHIWEVGRNPKEPATPPSMLTHTGWICENKTMTIILNINNLVPDFLEIMMGCITFPGILQLPYDFAVPIYFLVFGGLIPSGPEGPDDVAIL